MNARGNPWSHIAEIHLKRISTSLDIPERIKSLSVALGIIWRNVLVVMWRGVADFPPLLTPDNVFYRG